MCARRRIFFVPVPVNVARMILPILAGMPTPGAGASGSIVSTFAPSAAKRAETTPAYAVEAFDVAAAAFDRDELLEGVEQRWAFLLRASDDVFVSGRQGV